MSKVSFVCLKCGCKTFKTKDGKLRLDKHDVGAVCAGCGATLTKDDLGKQALKIAEKLARDIFKK